MTNEKINVFNLKIFLITEIYMNSPHLPPSPQEKLPCHFLSTELTQLSRINFSISSLQRENQSHKGSFYLSCPSSLKLNKIKSFNLVYKAVKVLLSLNDSLRNLTCILKENNFIAERKLHTKKMINILKCIECHKNPTSITSYIQITL